MKQFRTIAEYQKYRQSLDGLVGFVPTMGALHIGHQSLLERSIDDCDVTVLSIYVNPTQFNNPADLAKYPDTLEADLALAEEMGVDAVLLPTFDQLYPDDFRYLVDEKVLSQELCGAHRPGHFTGVLTVVMKLLNIVQPHKAYFGEKDYQQYLLIRGMAEAFHMSPEIISCATVRESDGLAFSSRNLNLKSEERALAPNLHRLISSDLDDNAVIEELTALGFTVDYVETKNGRRFAAATLGIVRLIDNVEVGKSL